MTLKTKTSVWLTIAITAVAGILFVVWRNNDVLSWFVFALGLMLIIPAVYLLITSAGHLKTRVEPLAGADGQPSLHKPSLKERFSFGSLFLVSLCTIAVGLWMTITPESFKGFMTFLFATVLVVYGIYLIIVWRFLSGHALTPVWFYIVPAILVATGLAIIFSPLHKAENESTVVLITGICLIALAANWIVQRIMVPDAPPQAIPTAAGKPEALPQPGQPAALPETKAEPEERTEAPASAYTSTFSDSSHTDNH